jgi:hypothetical protein
MEQNQDAETLSSMSDKSIDRRINSIYQQLSIGDKTVNPEHLADPALWATESFSLELDPWQIDALGSPARQSVWNLHRQAGKSTLASIKALNKSIFKPGSLTLMVSPSERQSGELYRKFLGYYDGLDDPPGMPEDKALSCTMGNGSRVVALPGIEDTIRSFSAVDLIIEDEASRVNDDLFNAVSPMLAVSQGDVILMSTPKGARGHFFHIFTESGPEWFKLKVTADQCPRISKEFLDGERKRMPDNVFRAEYLCEFTDTVDGCFTFDQISSAFSAEVEPLILEGIAEW